MMDSELSQAKDSREVRVLAAMFRLTRDIWIGKLAVAKSDAERAEIAENALDSFYTWLLVHDLIERDSDEQIARVVNGG